MICFFIITLLLFNNNETEVIENTTIIDVYLDYNNI